MTPFLIDSHTHLDFRQFNADREDVIYRAKEANVKAMITIGTDPATSKEAIKIAEKHTNIFAAIGVHPHDAAEASKNDILELKELLQHDKVVAIGEVGLDFYRNISAPDVQRKMLRMFLDWSQENGLPLIVHTREADEEILTVIREHGKNGWQGVFHCFAGDQYMADQVLEMGFHISFTGNITFKNYRRTDVVNHVPLEKLLVETDCPFLTPVPHRGKRNEPAFVHFVAQKIAEIKGVPVNEVARITTANAVNLFAMNIEDEE
ncbi:MAG: YchF/TatD family DNA exonuclease [Actinobacteria bacterium]|nr:YchF/TatD family DNA exonuclease [Actinomycetota bacterium]